MPSDLRFFGNSLWWLQKEWIVGQQEWNRNQLDVAGSPGEGRLEWQLCGGRDVAVQFLGHILEVEPMEIADGSGLRLGEKEGMQILPGFWLRQLDRRRSLY